MFGNILPSVAALCVPVKDQVVPVNEKHPVVAQSLTDGWFFLQPSANVSQHVWTWRQFGKTSSFFFTTA